MNETLKVLGMTEEKAISILERLIGEDEDIDFYSLDEKMAFEMAISALKDRPKGEWIRHTRVEPVYSIDGVKTWGMKCQCNQCTFTTIAVEDFGYYDICPNCGADMRGKAE